ncbi:MAG: ABC transporter ATP-binding protein [Bacteroidota bacterium]
MEIELHNIAKRFRYEWIFRNLDYTFQSGQSYAILGPNGTGKSTLLKILSGHLSPSKGKIEFRQGEKIIDIDQVYQNVSYAAPYIDLIEELTLREAIDFHRRFRNFREQLQTPQLIELLRFEHSVDKAIKYFSSGMKQRLKLVLAICTDAPLLLLDEPTTNLDEEGMEWYHQLIERFGQDRLIIVASNVAMDYRFCEQQLNILSYKVN